MRELRLLPIVLAVAAIVVVMSQNAAAADLKTGEMIDKDSWQKAIK